MKMIEISLFLAACSPAGSQASDARATAPASAEVVDGQSSITSLMRSARPGTTVRLPPGTYSNNVVKNLSFDPPVTVTSADPAHPATLTDLDVQNAGGLDFANLVFTAPLYSGPPDPGGT